MIIEKREVKEYRKDGSLMYETTYGVVDPNTQNQHEARAITITPEGELLVRVGTTTAYHKNGQVRWRMTYDEKGSLKPDTYEAFREDGTRVIY